MTESPRKMSNEEWLATPIDPRSHSWCGDCGWKGQGPWAHRDAQAHGVKREHVMHVYEAEATDPPEWHQCEALWTSGTGFGLGALACTRPRNHEGSHERDGFTWTGREGVILGPGVPVHKAVDNSGGKL